MSELTRQGRYDRMTNTLSKLTGEAPTSMRDFVKLHAAQHIWSPSYTRLLDRNAPFFETATVTTLKRVDIACIALRLGAE